jgi:hypothetical protein
MLPYAGSYLENKIDTIIILLSVVIRVYNRQLDISDFFRTSRICLLFFKRAS